jgi:hypothetical protein
VDVLVAGHTLDTLEDLADLLCREDARA